MIKEWYYNSQNGQRYLSVEEIASACCVASTEVRAWLVESSYTSTQKEELLLDSCDIISFLNRNRIPIPSSLLPPNTKKILFIASEEHIVLDYAVTVNRICSFFAHTSNILVEISSVGRFAGLSVFIFSPDIVVVFLKTDDRNAGTILNLLSCLPDAKSILLLDNIPKIAIGEGVLALSADLVVSNALSPDKLISQLRSVSWS